MDDNLVLLILGVLWCVVWALTSYWKDRKQIRLGELQAQETRDFILGMSEVMTHQSEVMKTWGDSLIDRFRIDV